LLFGFQLGFDPESGSGFGCSRSGADSLAEKPPKIAEKSPLKFPQILQEIVPKIPRRSPGIRVKCRLQSVEIPHKNLQAGTLAPSALQDAPGWQSSARRLKSSPKLQRPRARTQPDLVKLSSNLKSGGYLPKSCKIFFFEIFLINY